MGFSRLDQTRYTFKIIKMVANNKVALLKARTSIMLSKIVKRRRARRATKRRAIWVREWINKNWSKLSAFHTLQKRLRVIQDFFANEQSLKARG